MRIKASVPKPVLLVILGLLLACLPSYPQQAIPTVKDETYSQIVDKLFPRELYTDQEVIYSLVIRFSPSFDLPEQLCLTGFRAGSIRIVRLSLSDNKSVIPRAGLRTLVDHKFAETGKEDPDLLAGFFAVNRSEMTAASSDLKLLLAQLSQLEFTPKVGTKVVLDGTRYEVWFKSYSSSLYYSVRGPDVGRPPYRDQAVEWMNLVLEAVKKSDAANH